jgi:hypothetical protein
MSNPLDARQWFGLFLFIALGLLIWGQTILKPHLKGLGLSFTGSFCLLMLAMLTALLDFGYSPRAGSAARLLDGLGDAKMTVERSREGF